MIDGLLFLILGTAAGAFLARMYMVRKTSLRFLPKKNTERILSEQSEFSEKVWLHPQKGEEIIKELPFLKKALDTQVAIEELRKCARTQFCPQAVDAFLQVFESGGFIE